MNLEKCKRLYGNVLWTGKKCILGMPISFTRYIITDSKLITRVGLLSLHEDELELYRVIDKTMRFPFGQRIFFCGTIKITAKDSDTPIKELKSIKKTRQVKQILDDLVQEQRDKYYVRGRDMVGGAAFSGDGEERGYNIDNFGDSDEN